MLISGIVLVIIGVFNVYLGFQGIATAPLNFGLGAACVLVGARNIFAAK